MSCKPYDLDYDKNQEDEEMQAGIFPVTYEADPNGIRQHESGAKLDKGKIKSGILSDFSLALTEVAKVGTYGAEKYSRRGWELVPNGIERYNDAKWRHLLTQKHHKLDDETGLLHLAQEAWNTLAELELTLRDEKYER